MLNEGNEHMVLPIHTLSVEMVSFTSWKSTWSPRLPSYSRCFVEEGEGAVLHRRNRCILNTEEVTLNTSRNTIRAITLFVCSSWMVKQHSQIFLTITADKTKCKMVTDLTCKPFS